MRHVETNVYKNNGPLTHFTMYQEPVNNLSFILVINHPVLHSILRYPSQSKRLHHIISPL